MTRSPHSYLFTACIPLLAMALTTPPDRLSAQSSAVQGRVKLEQARLAIEQEDFPKALTLYEEIIGLLGPKGEYQYHAAWAAFETGQFRKAKEYIYAAIEGGDEDFELLPEYDEAFRLAAEIENKVSELDVRVAATEARAIRMDSLAIRSTELPLRNDLSAPGLVKAAKNDHCEYRFAHGGLVIKADEGHECTRTVAWLGGLPYRVSVVIEEKGSKKTSDGAGLAFGFSSWSNFSKVLVERKDDSDQGVWLRGSNARVVARDFGRLPSNKKGKGPFVLRLEVRPFIDGRTQVAAYVDGRYLVNYVVDYGIAGGLLLYVHAGEYVFRDLVIERMN